MKQERIYKVILAPHVSEKTTMTADKHNQYVFRVVPDATKVEVKKAVEELFKVNVESVNVLNQKGKTKRTAHGLGRKASIRKAYVRLAAGQEIDFTEAE